MSILPYDSRNLSFGPLEEKINREGKWGWYLKTVFFFGGEIKQIEKKLYLEKENIFFQRRAKPDKKNEEYIWRQKYIFAVEKINSRGKGEKYLEKEIFLKLFFCKGEE